MMSPDQPTTRQISPVASALMIFGRMKLADDGLASCRPARPPFRGPACLVGIGIEAQRSSAPPAECRRRESSIWTPQSLNFARFSGLKTMSQLSIFAVRPERLFGDLLDVVADAGRAPHVVGGELIAGS